MDWARDGVRAAAARGDVVIIVDVLRFSTAVAAAVASGCGVYPCISIEEAGDTAIRLAEGAGPGPSTRIVSGYGFLSPAAYRDTPRGTRVALPSPNGATCSRYAEGAAALFAGALVNATAVASAIEGITRESGPDITVVSAGERRSGEDGLRPALEDYLGAGAIISRLTCPCSVEARICAAAFRSAEDGLEEILLNCESGRELREKGLTDDVRLAARTDVYTVAPILRGGRFQALA
jgi:2-phosphosulfolactate phosphatase